jgi:hypothetical protein
VSTVASPHYLRRRIMATRERHRASIKYRPADAIDSPLYNPPRWDAAVGLYPAIARVAKQTMREIFGPSVERPSRARTWGSN